MTANNIVQRIWSLCNVLRGDGISYHKYIAELTYLLFLKIAEENNTEDRLPKGYRWNDLANYNGDNLLGYYQEMLTHLGATASNKIVKEIYAFPTTVFSHSENLRVVIDGIKKIDWHSVSEDGIGQIYEGLLAKNSEDARSGAGQYFTPRALVDCIIKLTKPGLGELIQDPAIGTGGFIISADHYIREVNKSKDYERKPPLYEGVEIERGTYRICLMNTFLHRMNAKIYLGDALTSDAHVLSKADVILANPPFGSKVGSARKTRSDFDYPTSNKQLEFLQHIYNGLKHGGRAAVVLPDNVLFEDGIGRKIRQDLMEKCNLHTILRLPTGIFYSQGVKTNVLFFSRGETDRSNTKSVWIYDMRANMPQFGKRTPLQMSYFEEFIKLFGDNAFGKSERTDLGTEGRFRCFSRKFIKDNNDNLFINWLGSSESNLDSTINSESLALETIEALENAVISIKNIFETLSSTKDNLR